jgi:hypothetical protein
MRLILLLFTAALTVSPAWAQQAPPSPPADLPYVPQDKRTTQDAAANHEPADKEAINLPVSIDKIREALEQPAPLLSLRTIDERPTFRVQIQERQKIEALLATLNFKTAPAPGGGLYGFEQQRQMFPAVDNPLRQPYAAFNQGELLTILIENLAMKYLGGRALNAITNAERARAEAAAKEEVREAVAQYCAAQPRQGAGIQICETTVR